MKKIFYFLVIASIGTFISCEKDKNNDTPETTNNKYVNAWIKENMDVYYYWNTKIPTNVDNTQNPGSYFNALLYKYNKSTAPNGDRFSWIQENYVDLLESLSGVVNNEVGFEYSLYGYSASGTTKVFGEISYIKKGTDAANKGLQRGQVFTHVNGTELDINNYKTLLAMTGSNVALKISTPSLSGDIISFNDPADKNLALLSKYAENPILLDTTYTISGKNIGYLVYNFFAADAEDGTGAYDLALNGVFGKFKGQSISELVLDLRYNSGGSVRSAIYLASMIAKNLNTSNTFLRAEYNSFLQAEYTRRYGSDIFIDKFTDKVAVYNKNNVIASEVTLNNLGNNITTLYVLTSGYTASASEMIINGLKPYMDVYLVGDTTVGKNVGSISIYEENDPKNKWGLQPIVAKFYNSANQSDFTAGFAPNEYMDDSWDTMPKKALGDITEPLLSKAIQRITGGGSPVQAQNLIPHHISITKLSSSLDKKAWKDQLILPSNRLP